MERIGPVAFTCKIIVFTCYEPGICFTRPVEEGAQSEQWNRASGTSRASKAAVLKPLYLCAAVAFINWSNSCGSQRPVGDSIFESIDHANKKNYVFD
jgi:hypothetical protein